MKKTQVTLVKRNWNNQIRYTVYTGDESIISYMPEDKNNRIDSHIFRSIVENLAHGLNNHTFIFKDYSFNNDREISYTGSSEILHFFQAEFKDL